VLSTVTVTSAQMNCCWRLRRSTPAAARLAEDLEAVADAEHRAALAGEARSPTPSPARSARSPRSGGSRRTRILPAAPHPRFPAGSPASACQTRTGSAPSSSSAIVASPSSFEPGNVTTAIRGPSLTGRPRPRS
jgi:hypothetical protein